MLEMLEQTYEEVSYKECPWCENGVNIDSKENVYDVDDSSEGHPFCCDWCLESYLQKHDDIYQLIRMA